MPEWLNGPHSKCGIPHKGIEGSNPSASANMNLYKINKNTIFLISQKAVIENHGKFLILKSSFNNRWELPGGLLEVSENLNTGLKREVKEETNLTISVGKLICLYPHFHKNFKLFDGRKVRARILEIFYHCKLLSGIIKLSDEHAGYKWITKKELSRGRDTDKKLITFCDKVNLK